VIAWLKSLYLAHFQKTIASLLGSLAFLDLTGDRDSIVAFIGERGYAGLRLIGAAAIVWRATRATKVINTQITDAVVASEDKAP
jgi:hypothetical protein